MAVPFLNNIDLNKYELQNFKIFNIAGDPTGGTLVSGDAGYTWLNTSTNKIRWWDGAAIRDFLDTSSSISGSQISGNISGNAANVTSVVAVANGGTGTSTGSITGTGALTLASGGANNNLNLNPTGTGTVVVGGSGYLQANITGTADKAVELSTSRTLWGQSFNGTANVTGDLSSVGNITGTAAISITTGGSNTSITLAPNGTGTVDVSSKKITHLATPVDSTDAANKSYVDSVAQGLDAKSSCYVATNGTSINLANPGTITIDSIPYTDFTVDETRILVKDQSTAAQNGIYIWHGDSSAMTRSPDANTWSELVGAYTFIEKGTVNAYSGYICSIPPTGTLGTTDITWTKFSQAGSYTPGRGITQSGTAFNFAQDAEYTANQIPYTVNASTIGFKSTTGSGNVVLATAPTVTGLISDTINVGSGTLVANLSSYENKVGIGTVTPGTSLDIWKDTIRISTDVTSGIHGLQFWRSAAERGRYAFDFSASLMELQADGDIRFLTGGENERLRISSTGVFTWSNVVNAGTAMVLDGTGLGIGTASPASKLDLKTAAGTNCLIEISGNNNTSGTGSLAVGQLADNSAVVSNRANASLIFGTNNSGKVWIDSSGNVGIGGAPSVWTSLKVLQLQRVSLSSGTSDTYLTSNSYYKSGIGWSFISDNPVSQMYMNASGGEFVFRNNIAGGTADTAVSWTTLATLNSAGNLGIGVAPSSWDSTWKVLQLNSYYSAFGGDTSGSVQTFMSSNAYYNGSTWKGGITGSNASLYRQYAGKHEWYYTTNVNNGVGFTFTSAMTLDTSGNLGIGVAPSNWGSSWKSLDFRGTGAISTSNAGAGDLSVTYNAYYDTTDARWEFKATGDKATRFSTTGSGDFTWYNTSSAGTAPDTLIGWSTLATLNSTGLGIGTITPAAKLEVVGSAAPQQVVRLTASNGYCSLRLYNDQNSSGRALEIDYSGSAFTGSLVTGGPTGESASITTTGAYPLTLGTNNTARLTIASTGAATFAGDVTVNGTGYTKRGTATFYKIPGIYSEQLTGTGSSFVINHALGSRDVSVTVRQYGSPYAVVITDVEMTDTNNVTVKFASSVNGTLYTVTVIG